MAVQAQYPSNILFLNRNVPEGHDYPTQPQPGGGFLQQSNTLFNSGESAETNPRKRGREAANSMDIMSSSHAILNLHSLQPPPPPQLIDLAQLQNHRRSNAVSTGLRLSSDDRQNHQHFEQNHKHFSHRSITPSPPSPLSGDFAAQIKQEGEEIYQFLQAQGEQFRRALAEKRQRHHRALLLAAEAAAARRLREKDAELEGATRRNAELTSRAAQLGSELRAWEARALAQEAAAASLRAQLEKATTAMSGRDRRSENVGKVVDGDGMGPEGPAEDAESIYVDPDRVVEVSGPVCRACGGERAASVVMLPCRHLCVCAECDRVVGACPVCLCARVSSVEVFLC